MIKQNNILQFNNLSQFDLLTHGFSTRFFGDMRPSHHQYAESIKKFIEALGVSKERLVRMDQVHGNKVYSIKGEDAGKAIAETDGLISSEKDVYLGVITADCVPLLIYDSKKQFVAAVHAGWRGLFKEIIKVAVSELIEKGSDPKDLIVGIGPSIRVCCYEVSEEFVANFKKVIPGIDFAVERRDGKIFFDLQKIAKEQLAATGVLDSNIEDGDYCTFEHEDIYSCRKEGEDFGEMIGIIGMHE